MSGDDVAAREAALLRWRSETPDAPWSPDHDDAFRDGWGNNGLRVPWLPSLDEANVAGRRARAQAQEVPDARD